MYQVPNIRQTREARSDSFREHISRQIEVQSMKAEHHQEKEADIKARRNSRSRENMVVWGTSRSG
jgi:hypothetical protein